MHKYNDSPALLLSTVYPEYDWLPWRFSHSPRSIWKSTTNLRKFFDWAGNQLGIKEAKDWNKVATNVKKICKNVIKIKDIIRLGGKDILQSSLSAALSNAYPEHSEEFSTLEKSGFSKKSQHLLKIVLKSIFPQKG